MGRAHAPPLCAGAAGPPSEGPGGPRRAQHMGAGFGRAPLHAHRYIYIYIGILSVYIGIEKYI